MKSAFRSPKFVCALARFQEPKGQKNRLENRRPSLAILVFFDRRKTNDKYRLLDLVFKGSICRSKTHLMAAQKRTSAGQPKGPQRSGEFFSKIVA